MHVFLNGIMFCGKNVMFILTFFLVFGFGFQSSYKLLYFKVLAFLNAFKCYFYHFLWIEYLNPKNETTSWFSRMYLVNELITCIHGDSMKSTVMKGVMFWFGTWSGHWCVQGSRQCFGITRARHMSGYSQCSFGASLRVMMTYT